MVIAQTIQERNAVMDAVATVSNSDGTFTVYQEGDAIPEALQSQPVSGGE